MKSCHERQDKIEPHSIYQEVQYINYVQMQHAGVACGLILRYWQIVNGNLVVIVEYQRERVEAVGSKVQDHEDWLQPVPLDSTKLGTER